MLMSSDIVLHHSHYLICLDVSYQYYLNWIEFEIFLENIVFLLLDSSPTSANSLEIEQQQQPYIGLLLRMIDDFLYVTTSRVAASK